MGPSIREKDAKWYGPRAGSIQKKGGCRCGKTFFGRSGSQEPKDRKEKGGEPIAQEGDTQPRGDRHSGDDKRPSPGPGESWGRPGGKGDRS